MTDRPGAADAPRWWRPGLAGIAAVAAVAALAASALLFPYLTSDSDEGAYLAEAQALAAGHLSTPAPARHPDAYQPWFARRRDSRYVYKYTPVHAALLAIPIGLVGSPVPALALIAAADVVLLALLARALGASHRAALGAGALFALSPAFLVQAGTFLPYLSELGLLLGCAVLLSRGLEARRGALLVAAGALLGLAFFGRQYDAVLFSLPLLAVAARWYRRHGAGPADAGRSLALVVAGALPVLGVFAWYDAAVTGSALRLPFTLLDRHDTLGFGPRRVLPTDPLFAYTPRQAVSSSARWLLLVVNSVAGGLPLTALAGLTLLRARRMPGRTTLLVLLVSWPLGYAFFWGIYSTAVLWDGAIFLGPFYFLPMVAGVAVAGALGIERLARQSRNLALLVGVLMVVTWGASMAFFISDNLGRTHRRQLVADALDRAVPADRPTLIFLPPVRGNVLQHPFTWLRNRPDLGGPRRYAVAVPGLELAALADAPGRQPWLLSTPGGFEDAKGPTPNPIVTRQHLAAGPVVALRLTARSTVGPCALTTVLAGGSARGVAGPEGATVRVRRTGAGVDLVGPDGSVLDQAPLASGASTTLDVACVAAGAGAGARQARLELPVGADAGRVVVLAPGQVMRWSPTVSLDVAVVG